MFYKTKTMNLLPIFLTTFFVAVDACSCSTICLLPDGKKQPLVFDSVLEEVVYPTDVCGPKGAGELFTGVDLLTLCIGGKNNGGGWSGKGPCPRINNAVVERDYSLDEEDCKGFRKGFRIPGTDHFHTVFSLCWVDRDMHAKWVRNKINPGIVTDDEDLVDSGIRTKFKYSSKIFGKGFNPRPLYSLDYQERIKILKSHFNKRTGNFFARGHLAPAGDFFLASERWATFALENAVPQIQNHNNGEWKDIENRARTTPGAAWAETGPIFYQHKKKEYLDKKKKYIPIPHALYKIVYDKNNKELFRVQSDMSWK
ncbi:wsv191 [White spot syndrome virus]|uniref:Wsv191 n=1 Tax=White spot syndrome virus TaxID=342409 RepID=K7WHE2_9VIRU|nr:wsv191 [White spot syndrome virus]